MSKLTKIVIGLILLSYSLISLIISYQNTERYSEKPTWWTTQPAELITFNFEGCGWDGVHYCSTFYSYGTASEPFSRRILSPLIASTISKSPINGFLIVNISSLLFSIILSCILIIKNIKTDYYNKILAMMLIASVILSSRNTFHLLFPLAVNSDHIALLFLLISTIYLYYINEKKLLIFGFLIGIIAPLSREIILIPLMATLTFAILFKKLNPINCLVVISASLIGTYLAFHQPALIMSSKSSAEILLSHFREIFGSVQVFYRFFIEVILALGGFFILFFTRGSLYKLENYNLLVYIMCITYVLISVFGGADTDRILMPAGILLIILSGRISLSSNIKFYIWISLVIQYIIIQCPFISTENNTESVLQFFGLRYVDIKYVYYFGTIPIVVGSIISILFLIAKPVLLKKTITTNGI